MYTKASRALLCNRRTADRHQTLIAGYEAVTIQSKIGGSRQRYDDGAVLWPLTGQPSQLIIDVAPTICGPSRQRYSRVPFAIFIDASGGSKFK